MSLYQPFADPRARAAEMAALFAPAPAERALLDRMIDEIDEPARQAFLERHRAALADFNPSGPYKYGDLPYWLAHKIRLAAQIGLDRAAPLAMLDLGAGGGFLCRVARALGHDVLGTDIGFPFFEDVCDLLGVARVTQPVLRGTPYPGLGRRFDLITIVWQAFDRPKPRRGEPRRFWTAEEDWAFLLRDLVEHHLVPGGRIFMVLNRLRFPDGERLDPALLAWARARGAEVIEDRKIVDFRDLRPGRM